MCCCNCCMRNQRWKEKVRMWPECGLRPYVARMMGFSWRLTLLWSGMDTYYLWATNTKLKTATGPLGRTWKLELYFHVLKKHGIWFWVIEMTTQFPIIHQFLWINHSVPIAHSLNTTVVSFYHCGNESFSISVTSYVKIWMIFLANPIYCGSSYVVFKLIFGLDEYLSNIGWL